MPRHTEPNCAGAIYDAAARWVKRCLVADGSLLEPSADVWTAQNLDELINRVRNDPLTGSAKFEEKLAKQLLDARREVRLLASEALLIHVLISMDMKAATKLALVRSPLQGLDHAPEVPVELVRAFEDGLVHPGTAFQTYRPNQVMFVLDVALHLKQLPAAERTVVLDDPARFRELVFAVPPNSAYSQQEALLHLIQPEHFEAIVSREHKKRIVARFKHLVTSPAADIDTQIAQIREGLKPAFGSDPGLFYRTAVQSIWREESGEKWTTFLDWARRFREFQTFDETERDYKLEIASRMAAVRDALLDGRADWPELLKKAFGPPNNLTTWRQHDPFTKFAISAPDQAKDALLSLWDEDAPEVERVEAFCDSIAQLDVGGAAGQANLASVLLMALGAPAHPPFRASPLADGFKLTGFPPPDEGAAAPERYAHSLEFYDRMLLQAKGLGIALRDRLDAQSVLWSVTRDPGTAPPVSEWPERLRTEFFTYRGEVAKQAEPTAEWSGEVDWGAMARRCFMPLEDVTELRDQLLRRQQLVFYGPPGTGKTYIAQELAQAFVRETGGATRLVQFHPSYSYEDFVEGLKPRIVDGAIEYAVEPGVLRELTAEALARPEQRFVLVVDEMNRANLSKVFGELFFLLEYRDSDVRLPYSKENFRLPKNLFLIGTMNTADRSIAVVDFALRRRFGFVGFFPKPEQPVLREYLAQHAPHLDYVADMLTRLNELIGDRNYALGHSYFMPRNPEVLDETFLREVWRYSIEPHLEEYWYDEPSKLIKCTFDSLRTATSGVTPEPAPEERDS